eukprot:8165342-Pyramimonas_sp.AAC.2
MAAAEGDDYQEEDAIRREEMEGVFMCDLARVARQTKGQRAHGLTRAHFLRCPGLYVLYFHSSNPWVCPFLPYGPCYFLTVVQELTRLAGLLKLLKEENTQLRSNFDNVGLANPVRIIS